VIGSPHGAPVVLHDLASIATRTSAEPVWRQMRTFVGLPVRLDGETIGALGAFFAEALEPSDDDKRFMGIVAAAIGSEEKRWRAVREKEELQEHLRQSQRIESLGRLASGVAHDFNNLLTVISCSSEALMRGYGAAHPVAQVAERINKAAASGANLTRQLLAFGRKQALQPRVIQLNDVITHIEKMLRRLIGEDIEFITSLSPDVGCVRADPGQIEQVIINLAVNARDAMPEGGRLRIETRPAGPIMNALRARVPFPDRPHVLLSVNDNGCGMSPDILEHIFEPFFTTKEPGKGTGLGLSTVYGIVKQSDGFVTVDSEVGRGSTFRVYLPETLQVPETKPAVVTPTPEPQGTETILIVEDEEIVRELMVEMLSRQGYSVLTARNGEEALEVEKQREGPIHALLTDLVMPKMGGAELARRLKQRRPDIRVLYTSGYTSKPISLNGSSGDEIAFIEKPFTEKALISAIRKVLLGQPLT